MAMVRLTAVCPITDVVWSAVRKPFGEKTITSATVDFPIRLPGQYYDSETGLHYNQQRYYDPETGQYLRPDPLSLRGGYHTYNYAAQNPLAYVDLEGDLFFLAAIPYIVTGISAMTAYEVYDTVDGLASGRVTKEDLAAGYLQDKAIDVGIKAIPGVGSTAYLVRKSLKRSKVDDVAAKNPLARGRAAEQRVLNDLGLPKNTQKVRTGEGASIPGALTKRQFIEIKDCIGVSCTRQVGIQTEAARNAERESVLITGDKTHVSRQAQRAFDNIIRRSDLGPQ